MQLITGFKYSTLKLYKSPVTVSRNTLSRSIICKKTKT